MVLSNKNSPNMSDEIGSENSQREGIQIVSKDDKLNVVAGEFFESKTIRTPLGFIALYGDRQSQIGEDDEAYILSEDGIKPGKVGEFYDAGLYEIWVTSEGISVTGEIPDRRYKNSWRLQSTRYFQRRGLFTFSP